MPSTRRGYGRLWLDHPRAWQIGASELNYSSDIDLIILHDPDSTPLFAADKAQQFYVEQTRALVRLLSQSTGDGIGWRVDLRLRPDPERQLSASRSARHWLL